MAKRSRAASTRTRRTSRTLSVDMTGVELGAGGGFKIAEGEYLMAVDSVEKGVSGNDNEQLEWIFIGKEGKAKGKKFYYYTTLTPESLWKLGNTLDHLGEDVPDDVMEIDLDDLVGKELIGVVADDEYQGKIRSKLMDTMPVDGEATTKKADKKSSRKAAKMSADELDDLGEDELQDLIDDNKLDVDLGDHKTLRRKVAAVKSAMEENDLLAD